MSRRETQQRGRLIGGGGRLACGARRAAERHLLNALLWLAAALLPAGALAQSALSDDAQTSTAQKSSNTNFGANPNLNVSAAGNVYLKFKLTSTLPAGPPGAEVERATLKLYVGNVTTPGRLDLYAVAGTWDEATITAANAPPLGALAAAAQVGSDRRGKFLVFDVTTLVRQWLGDDGQGTNGIPNHGLAFVSHPPDAETPEAADVTFDSKENSQTSHEAQLNLHLKRGADGLREVEHEASLTGDGTAASPLGVAAGGINGVHLAADAVTGEKIAAGAVTSSELADGSVTSAKVTAPLSLTSAGAGPTLSVENIGAGAAIKAQGSVDTSTQYDIGGSRVLSNAGTDNLFAGVGAGAVNTGNSNAFFGRNAGFSNTSGDHNAFFGNTAGGRNTTGGRNAFFGSFAGSFNTTGSRNSFFGVSTGNFNTGGFDNSFYGFNAGLGNTTGSFNSFFGRSAGANNTTGSGNILFGRFAGLGNTAGNNLTLIGTNANVGADNLDHATALGADAVVSTSNTVVLGRGADMVRVPGTLSVAGPLSAEAVNAATQFNLGGFPILTGSGLSFTNLIAGLGAGHKVTGSFNSFFGRDAGQATTTGGGNSFFGAMAGRFNTTGLNNSFFGLFAGRENVTGSSNSFFGMSAGLANTTGDRNSFFGEEAGLRNATGASNSFFGKNAGRENSAGLANSFFGVAAGGGNTTGSFNSFFGAGAGDNNTTGSGNTFVGNGTDFDLPNATGRNNTLLGMNATVASGLNNATALGFGARVTQSDSLVLGASGSFSPNVGIATTAPRARLHVAGGKVYVEANGQGVVLKSPGGACFELTVTDAGALAVASATCP